jgi:hypothetical protein
MASSAKEPRHLGAFALIAESRAITQAAANIWRALLDFFREDGSALDVDDKSHIWGLDCYCKGSGNGVCPFGDSMPEPIAERVATLPNLDRVALCHLWKEIFNASPPPQLRKDFMIPILAYQIQAQAFKPLSAAVCGRLRQLARAFETNSNAAISSQRTIKPGTRLVRQWRDRVHLVNVEARGYEYQGVRYQSLSKIARLITGTRWSGPVFFGITPTDQTSKSKESK